MAKESAVFSEPVFHPPQLWGLDFHFNTFNKLYIADILNLKPYPRYPGAFAYGNHPVYKVDVLGVVVRKDDKAKLFLYSVDDGTGVINCCCWKQPFNSNEEQMKNSNSVSKMHPELQSQLAALKEERENAVRAYELGDLVHIRGKLKLFRDMMEIVAYYHCKIDNPSCQMKRMQELPHLYRQCYDKPFVPPYKIQQELLRVSGGNGLPAQKSQSLFQQLTEEIQRVLLKKNVQEFSLTDLLKEPEIAELTKEMDKDRDSTAVLEQVLRRLEEDKGTVCCRRRSSPPYENLNKVSPLQRHVVDILRKECSRPKYTEKGCHYLHILDELQRTVQYSRLHKTALLHVLEQLETSSDVIRVTDKCYMPL